jgi:prepilin-type N-terminal cleavage/methylation domain-containing protein
MKHRLFTLVELLTVIAVIAILAGIAIPVVVGMQSKGRETTARADMNAIKMALTQFKADYSIFPITGSSTDTLYHAGFSAADDDASIDTVISHLTLISPSPKGGDGSDKDNPVDYTSTLNKKKRKYLDAPAKPVEAKFTAGSSPLRGFMKLDPWGRRYNIAMDTNYDKKLALTEKFLSLSNEATVKETIVGDIAIYSYGTAEDGGDTEAFLYSWKTNADQ